MLKNAIKSFFGPRTAPEGVTVYKKVVIRGRDRFHREKAVLEMVIPNDAAKINRTGKLLSERKCRAERAFAVRLHDMNAKKPGLPYVLPKSAYIGSEHDRNFVYKLNRMIYPDKYDPKRNDVCSHGIHYFKKFEDAAVY